jgi:hypothetical protein
MNGTKYVTYVYAAPYSFRDYWAFKTEAEAFRFQTGLTAQGRASRVVTTTGNSYDEHQALLREFRADHEARVSA